MTQTQIEVIPATGISNPYVGPQSFSRKEHRFFKGRERETSELGDLLAARRLVLFYAESGAGKTSLINAGLASLLEKREFEVLPVARVAGSAPEGITPNNIYAFNVMAAIDRNQQSAHHFAGLDITDFLLDLEQVDGHFVHYPEVTSQAVSPATTGDAEGTVDDIPRRVLIIDQFEELFNTQAGSGSQAMREDFMRQIARAMADDPYLYVLLSMRADYVHHLSRYVHLLPDGLHTRYYMSRMRPAEALRAVAEPARAAGRPFDKGVAEELIERLARERNQTPGGVGEEWIRGETVEPVQLQVVCFQLWESVAQSDDARIGREDLNRVARSMLPDGVVVGDPLAAFVDSALGSYYEQTLADALRVPDAAVGEQFLRNWFSQELITQAGTRGFVMRSETETAGVPEAVLAVLLARHLVRSETRAGSRWVELVHDTFIAPVRQANDAWLQRQMRETPWIAAAYRWAERGRPANELLAGELLESALMEARDLTAHAEIVRAFLTSSLKAETDRKEAEEEASVAGQLARAKVLKRFTYALGAVALVAVIASFIAGFFATRAYQESEFALFAQATADAARATSEFNEEESRRAAAEAVEARSVAIAALATSEANEHAAREAQTEVERLNRETRSRRLAAEALLALARDPEEALLIAAAAYQATYSDEGKITGEGRTAIYRALDTPYKLTLAGHKGEIFSAVFNQEGTKVVTASKDWTARVWDTATGEVLVELLGHLGPVNSALFSPDGKWVVTASEDRTARVWEATNGELLTELVGHTGGIRSVVISSDGTRLVTADTDGTARIWDAASGQLLTELASQTDGPSSVALSPDGLRVVTANSDGVARVWDTASGNVLAELSTHMGGISYVAISQDGTRVFTVDSDGAARVWDVASGQMLVELAVNTREFWVAVFSPDGARLITASGDRTVQVWDSMSGEELAELSGHTDRIRAAAFNQDGSRVVTASFDGTARVWDTRNGELMSELAGHRSGLWSAAFSPDGTLVITTSADGTARVWEATNGEVQVILAGHTDFINSVAYSLDGERIVTASGDNTARVWDGLTGSMVAILVGHIDVIWTAAFSPDRTRVVTASGDHTAWVWNAETGEKLVNLIGHTAGVNSAAFSPDGTRVVTASEDRTSRVWDATSGETLTILAGHTEGINSVSFSPNGARVVTASFDGEVRVWDAVSGQMLVELDGHRSEVYFASFSPDGKRVVTASGDRTARIWDAVSGGMLAELAGHTSGVNSAAFSPNGAMVVTASWDGTARIWDAVSGVAMDVLLGHTDYVSSAMFNPDGMHVVTASGDGTARIWTLQPVDMLTEAQRRLQREPTDIIPNFCERYFQDSPDECPATLAQLFPAGD